MGKGGPGKLTALQKTHQEGQLQTPSSNQGTLTSGVRAIFWVSIETGLQIQQPSTAPPRCAWFIHHKNGGSCQGVQACYILGPGIVLHRCHVLTFTPWSCRRGTVITSLKMSLKTLKKNFIFSQLRIHPGI